MTEAKAGAKASVREAEEARTTLALRDAELKRANSDLEKEQGVSAELRGALDEKNGSVRVSRQPTRCSGSSTSMRYQPLWF